MSTLFTSIRRTPYQSLAAFMVLFFTLLLSSALFMALSFLGGLLSYVETRPQVTVYFQTKADQKDIFKIRDEVQQSGKVLSVKYVSKEEAYQIYKNLNKDNPLLLDMVSSDILPASLEIFAKQPSYLPELADYLKKQSGVDEVQFQKDIVDRLVSLTDIVRKTSIGLFVYLILMSIIVLTTTTLFKIAMKKDEIELLRLLGATNFYIKRPFIVEGLFFGWFAATCTLILLTGIMLYMQPFLSAYMRGIPALYLQLNVASLQVWPINLEFIGITYLFACLFGMIIAFIASYIATDKYLT